MSRHSSTTIRGIRAANRTNRQNQRFFFTFVSPYALSRPELRQQGDGFARKASTGATSAPVKVTDPETRRLIEEALARQGRGSP